MQREFTSIDSREALEALLARSHDGPVLLFKHSNTCPISAAAYRQMKQVSADVSIIVVQRARDVSREVESRTGLRHESPQALVLREGRVVWSASHWDITAEAVNQAMSESSH